MSDEKPKTKATHVLMATDYRLNQPLSAFVNLGTAEVADLLGGIKKMEQLGMPCVGHLVSTREQTLRTFLSEAETAALIRLQEGPIGVPRGTKLLGWHAPKEPWTLRF